MSMSPHAAPQLSAAEGAPNPAVPDTSLNAICANALVERAASSMSVAVVRMIRLVKVAVFMLLKLKLRGGDIVFVVGKPAARVRLILRLRNAMYQNQSAIGAGTEAKQHSPRYFHFTLIESAQHAGNPGHGFGAQAWL